MFQEQVILVDVQDNEIGRMEKQEAHLKGSLHRAFSVFLFNAKGDLLMQRRALHKYHSGGLWTNTCCSHPRPGEGNLDAAKRRLVEEMGIECELEHAFSFLYHQDVGELVEHELDHVFIGRFEGKPSVNPLEVAQWRYANPSELQAEMAAHPERFTVWFRLCFQKVLEFMHNGVLLESELPYIS